jgi:thiamine-phosphate pyrophosphorylase
VGQDDIDPSEARQIMGPDGIIGLSTHSREQIEAAASKPIDYISVGPIWETPTKEGRAATGLELIRTAAEIAPVPWFAIGGIDPGNVDEVVAAGAERICVVRAIRDTDDPRAAGTALFAAVDPAAREDAGE